MSQFQVSSTGSMNVSTGTDQPSGMAHYLAPLAHARTPTHPNIVLVRQAQPASADAGLSARAGTAVGSIILCIHSRLSDELQATARLTTHDLVLVRTAKPEAASVDAGLSVRAETAVGSIVSHIHPDALTGSRRLRDSEPTPTLSFSGGTTSQCGCSGSCATAWILRRPETVPFVESDPANGDPREWLKKLSESSHEPRIELNKEQRAVWLVLILHALSSEGKKVLDGKTGETPAVGGDVHQVKDGLDPSYC
ncbi:hypothetical protein DFH09DRAFT_1103875 [Mycena vulgaris]|nr:hypothetical protein DFH09DRAFT_1103875 [Mycena vulgaris]